MPRPCRAAAIVAAAAALALPATAAATTAPPPTAPTPSASAASTTTVASSTTTAPSAPTTTASAPPAVSFGQPIPIPLEVGNAPSFSPVAVQPPNGRHAAWLAVGTYSGGPGTPTEAAVYAGSDQSTGWRLVATTGALVRLGDVVTMPDGTETLVGSSEADGTLRAVTWTFDGQALSDPAVIGGLPGTSDSIAATSGPDGSLYVVVDDYAGHPEPPVPKVARRDPAGTWTAVEIAGAVDMEFRPSGVAVRDATVVVTGAGAGPDDTSLAMIFTSTDGGATFARVDADEMAIADTSTSLSPPVVGPDGFYAARCGIDDYARLHRYYHSADGITWEYRTFTTGPSEWTVEIDACGFIDVDSEGGVWMGFNDWDDYVYRVAGGMVDEFLKLETLGSGRTFEGEPLIAIADSAVAVAGEVRGGALAGIVPRHRDFQQTFDATTVVPMAGLPEWRESFHGVWTAGVDGDAVSIQTAPALFQEADGTYVAPPRNYPISVGDNGALGPDPGFGTARAGESDIVHFWSHLEGLEVLVIDYANLGSSTDDDGRIGSVLWSARTPGGAWAPPVPLDDRPGPRLAQDVDVVGGRVVVVGNEDQDRTDDQLDFPMLYVGDGASFTRIEVPSTGGATWLRTVCPLGGTRALLLGESDRAGFAVMLDVAAMTASPVELGLDVSTFVDCAANESGVLIWAGDPDGMPVFFATSDGAEFHEVAMVRGLESPHLDAGPAGFAVGGSRGPLGTGGVLYFGPTPDSMVAAAVPVLDGSAPHTIEAVVVRRDAVVLFGTVDNQLVHWLASLPPPSRAAASTVGRVPLLNADDPDAIEFVEAIRGGHVERLREMLAAVASGAADVGISGPGGQVRTLLHIATDWPGHFPNVAGTIGVLVAAGADVDAPFVGPHAERPLHWAASTDDVAALDALLDAGADIEAPGSVIDGSTALMDAVALGQWRAARRLVERGAAVTPWQAAALGMTASVETWLAGDPAPTADDLGRLLWAACHGGQLAMVQRLVAAGGAVDWVAPWDGTTPLEAARRSEANDVVQWLQQLPRDPA